MQRHKMHSYKRAAQGGEDFEDGAEAQTPGGEQAPENEALRDDARPAENVAENPKEDPAERCRAELEEVRLRAAAEMDNFKKRLSREHEEQLRYAAEKVLRDLLPTLDNLDLALQYGSKNEACRDMLQGVAMTHKLLLEAVTRHGLTRLGEEGEPFTPETQEAVGFEARPDLAPGVVSRVLQRGYKLGDRLLRPAKVMINQ